jgi:ABC-2 type transport system permease protein
VNTAAKIVAIARAQIVGHLTDRVGAAFVFLLPIIVVSCLGAVLDGYAALDVGVVAGRDPSSAIEAALRAQPGLRVLEFHDRAALESALRKQEVVAGVVPVPPTSAERAGGARLLIDAGRPYPAGARQMVLAALDRSSLGSSGGSSAVGAAVAGGARHGTVGVQLAAQGVLVIFMLLTAIGFAGSLVTARVLGTQRRMFATPTPRWAIVTGDVFGRLVLVLVQALVIVAITSLGFGMRWGRSLDVVFGVVSFACVCVVLAELVGLLARSREQVLAIASGLAIGGGMLGGCVWPSNLVGDDLRTLGHAVPQSWVMDLLSRAQLGAAGWRTVGDALVVVAFAVPLGVLTVSLSRRRMAR